MPPSGPGGLSPWPPLPPAPRNPPPAPPPEPPVDTPICPGVGAVAAQPAGFELAPAGPPVALPASTVPVIWIVPHDAMISGSEPRTFSVAPAPTFTLDTEIRRAIVAGCPSWVITAVATVSPPFGPVSVPASVS